MKNSIFALVAVAVSATAAFAADTPNVVIIFADDLGYADPGCFGSKTATTPNLDSLAKQGIRFTDFHSAQAVCSASRAALLTGCYANRIGIHGALFPKSRTGIHSDETTLAEVCKSRGYATKAIGKWHLGHLPEFAPTRHGFDSFFGLPYSNDMWPPNSKTYPPLPLLENEKVKIADVTAKDQSHLTGWYTEQAVKFIADHKSKPFFLYVAHSMPHVPLFVGDAFKGKSGQGLYGDVIMEIDWSVGQIMKAIDDQQLAEKTLIIFTSDNGPWLVYGNHGGNAGPLREGKGTSWEGGHRVPFVARWPKHIPESSECRQTAMTIDILPTVAKLIGAELPKLKIDGLDIGPLLRAEKEAKCPHEAFLHYYATNELQAVRSGKWKLVLPHTYRSIAGGTPGKDGKPGRYQQVKITKPELYDLEADVGESKNVAEANPDTVRKLMTIAETAREELGDSLTGRKGKESRDPGSVPEPRTKPSSATPASAKS